MSSSHGHVHWRLKLAGGDSHWLMREINFMDPSGESLPMRVDNTIEEADAVTMWGPRFLETLNHMVQALEIVSWKRLDMWI